MSVHPQVELCLHKRKIADVKAWFEQHSVPATTATTRQAPLQRLLLLSGPAGSGKSCLVRVLADTLGIKVQTARRRPQMSVEGQAIHDHILL
jgi:Holliday junction resolvasome RuvABC ATP-dependent DNA helicase subunit